MSFRRPLVSSYVALSVVVMASLAHAGALTPVADEGVHCRVVPAHDPSPAEKAYLDGKVSEAETLYRDALVKSPHDATLTAGLVRTLLREQKVDDAASAITAELAAPNSVPLLTASAEVQYRQGKIAEAATTADQAFHLDPCNPRLYLIRARILSLNSMYASERRAIGIAHSLDPSDMDIRLTWLGTLPVTQRIDELRKFLTSKNGLDSDERARFEQGLTKLEDHASNQDKTCHITSSVTSTEIPIVPLSWDGTIRHIRGWALHVSLNNNDAGLELDTGASGLLISKTIAQRAGLKSLARVQLGGVGDRGPLGGYVARVDLIRIGSLEFRDCIARVSDSENVAGGDGLIGADVFSSFLVTLDYPVRKLLLAPLPPRPTDGGLASLNTEGGDPTTSDATGSSVQSTGPPDRYVSPTMKEYSPVFRSGHDLILPVVLNGKTQRLFLVDSGAAISSISPEAARAVTKVRGGAPVVIKGVNGAVAKVSTSDKIVFAFGGIEQDNYDLYSFDTSSMSRDAGTEISGLLGNPLLSQLTMSIDYRDGLIKFTYDRRRGIRNVE